MQFRPMLMAAVAAGAILAPLPAHAGADQPGEDGGGELAETLSDPQAQLAASAALAAVAQTILDLDISAYARAIAAMGGGEAVRDLPPDARLGDLASPDAERMPETIARNVPRAMGSAAEISRSLDALKPQLKETARRLKRSLPRY